MALTFCTFGHELKDCFNIRINNRDFVNLLLAAVPVRGERYTVSKSIADSLMSGRRQVPEEIRSSLHSTSREEISEYFETFVIQYIPENRHSDIMANLLDEVSADVMVPDQEKAELIDYEKDDAFSHFLALSLFWALLTENVNPDMFIHRAPKLAPWNEMPDYSPYLKRINESFSKIRTLLYYDEPKPFYDFYVCNDIEIQPYFLYSPREVRVLRALLDGVENATIKSLAEASNYIIVTGTGGLGKSMMMRNLLLCSVRDFETDGMIPVFVPLKDYKEDDDDLLPYIYDKLTDGGKHHEVTLEQFTETLRHNRIQILLDGYDEIKTTCVDVFERALRKFMRKYPNNFYIMSSRPFDHFRAFRRFMMTELRPFGLNQSLELIDKLEFRPDEPAIKQKFAQQLRDNLYKTHREFASNPLLLTIMLMTFEQFAEVPSKMHVFYREAYATLSQKHDASKGAYKRALHSGLSADRFSDYFAEFCARTYSEEKYEMTRAEIVEYFEKLNVRKKSGDPEFTADDFIYDMHHNLCLLYHESGKYHFTHRSFQEYFCALYFSKQKDKALERIGESFEKHSSQSFGDKTFHMLYDMIPEKVEEYIFLPYLEKLFKDCSGDDGYQKYLIHHVKSIRLNPRAIYHLGGTNYDNDSYSFIGAFILRYAAHVDRKKIEIKFPYYKEFVIREYDVFVDTEGHKEIVPAGFGDRHMPDGFTLTDEKIYDSHYDFSKIYKAKDKYPDLIAIFESEDFQPYRNYKALKSYYEKLKAGIEEAEDDSLDFLG